MNWWSYYLPILAYHKVGVYRGDHVPTVSEAAFERQLEWIARSRLHVLSLEEVSRVLQQRGVFPRRCVAITFDDGYEEIYQVAWPCLKRHGFPATVFVTPAEIAQPGFVTWEQLRELASDRCIIGSHTMSHQYLPLVEPAVLEEEIVGSKRVLEERVGSPVEFLSYPVGGFTPTVQAIAKRAGYRAACTTNRAASRTTIDAFALRRIKMTDRDAHGLLCAAKLSGYYDLFRQLPQPTV